MVSAGLARYAAAAEMPARHERQGWRRRDRGARRRLRQRQGGLIPGPGVAAGSGSVDVRGASRDRAPPLLRALGGLGAAPGHRCRRRPDRLAGISGDVGRGGRHLLELRELRRQAVGRRDLLVVGLGGERLALRRHRRRRDAPAARDLRQRSRLDGRADRDDLVGVDAVEGRGAEELLDPAPHQRDARRPADQDDLVELAHRQLRDRQRLLADGERALDERGRRACRARRASSPKSRSRCAPPVPNATSRSLICARGFAERSIFSVLGRGAEALERLRVDARVVTVRVQERLGHSLGDRHVEVVAAEEGVAGGREHLEHVAREVEERAVEGAAAEVVDRDALLRRPPEAVRERRRRGLVDDAQDVEPGDPSRRPWSRRAAAR